MQPDFWHERWERGEIGFHQEQFNGHLLAFWDRLQLAPGSRVFVPLCGKSRDMLWLLAQGYEVLGVELSPLAVEGFFAENQVPVEKRDEGPFTVYSNDGLTLLCGDFFDLTPEMVADCAGVYDRASLVAMPPAMRPRYADHLRGLFPAGLNALLVTMEYPDEEMEGPPFSVSEPEVQALYGKEFAVERLLTCDILDENPHFRDRGLSRLEEKVYRLIPA